MSKYTLDHEIAARIESFNDGRQVRALFDGHRVRNRPGDGKFAVVSGSSGNEYNVDISAGRCDCPDAEGQRICKHQFAAMYATGAAVLPTEVLHADELAVDAIVDDETDVHDLDLVANYEQLALESGPDVRGQPRWATDDGTIVEHAQADNAAPAAADEPADIQAERALVEENSQQPAADGGAEICGAETARGEPCQRKGDCPYHGDADDESAANDDDAVTINADASSDTGMALADAATDGGTIAVDTERADDILDRVLEHADGRPIVVVVAN